MAFTLHIEKLTELAPIKSVICSEGGNDKEKPKKKKLPPEPPCFEDNTAYFGNNFKPGGENPQPSRAACRDSCKETPECHFWTWGKATKGPGPCFLKTKRENVREGIKDYVSGSKTCILPEDDTGGTQLGFR